MATYRWESDYGPTYLRQGRPHDTRTPSLGNQVVTLILALCRDMFQRRALAYFALGAIVVGACPARAPAADVRPTVVVGPQANEIEQYAASQLCDYLGQLFSLTIAPSSEVSPQATVALIVGSPTTNPVVAKALGAEGWPKVSDQGIVLKHCQLDGMPALVIGGGSSRATLWSVYELVERWGVRYLLHGDVLPETPGTFRLPPDDVVMEPKFVVRQWRAINCFACGPEAWGIGDYQPLLDQLAKLKFNRLLAYTYPWQPFLDLKHGGIERHEAWLWFNFHYPITDDMPGRELFGNAAEWWNPDMPQNGSYRELTEAAERHVHALLRHAKSRGFEIGMPVHIAEFPREFAPLLKDHRALDEMLGGLTVTPGPLQSADDPALCDLAAAVIKTTLDTYPEVDFIVPDVPEIPAWSDTYEQAWQKLDAKYHLDEHFSLDKIIALAGNRRGYAGGKERPVTEVKSTIATLYLVDKLITERKVLADTQRPDAFVVFCSMAEEVLPILSHVLPPGSETLDQVDYTPERIVARPEALAHVAGDKMRHTLIFTLHDDNVGLLPMSNTPALETLANLLRKNDWSGFSTRYWLVGDHDPSVAFLSRRAWDDQLSARAAYLDQFAAVCGEQAASDLMEMMREVEAVTPEMNQYGMGLTFPVSRRMIGRHLVPEPLEPRWVAWREAYRRALAAAEQARAKSTARGKPYVAYWIGRLKLGVGFFDCVESARALAMAQAELKQAEAAEDVSRIEAKRQQVSELARAAVSRARDMLEAFALAARDPSDRGTLAVLAEYVYRPLNEELQKVTGVVPSPDDR